MDSQDIKSEQNGKKYVKIACKECKKGHKGCDEYTPCGNCKKKGCDCIRIEPNIKRGRKRKSGTHNNINIRRSTISGGGIDAIGLKSNNTRGKGNVPRSNSTPVQSSFQE